MTRTVTIEFETDSGLADSALKHVFKKAVEHAAVGGTIAVEIGETND